MSCDVAAEGASQQVTASKSALKIAEQRLGAGPRPSRVLEFTLEKEAQFVEFRVVTYGSGAVSVHGVTIERAVR